MAVYCLNNVALLMWNNHSASNRGESGRLTRGRFHLRTWMFYLNCSSPSLSVFSLFKSTGVKPVVSIIKLRSQIYLTYSHPHPSAHMGLFVAMVQAVVSPFQKAFWEVKLTSFCRIFQHYWFHWPICDSPTVNCVRAQRSVIAALNVNGHLVDI